jgi:hypothetical protein
MFCFLCSGEVIGISNNINSSKKRTYLLTGFFSSLSFAVGLLVYRFFIKKKEIKSNDDKYSSNNQLEESKFIEHFYEKLNRFIDLIEDNKDNKLTKEFLQSKTCWKHYKNSHEKIKINTEEVSFDRLYEIIWNNISYFRKKQIDKKTNKTESFKNFFLNSEKYNDPFLTFDKCFDEFVIDFFKLDDQVKYCEFETFMNFLLWSIYDKLFTKTLSSITNNDLFGSVYSIEFMKDWKSSIDKLTTKK